MKRPPGMPRSLVRRTACCRGYQEVPRAQGALSFPEHRCARRVARPHTRSKAMRTSTAFFTGAGTVAIAVAAGLGGGLMIAEGMHPKTPAVEQTKLERSAPDASAPSPAGTAYLAATQAAATGPIKVAPAPAEAAATPVSTDPSPAPSAAPATTAPATTAAPVTTAAAPASPPSDAQAAAPDKAQPQ